MSEIESNTIKTVITAGGKGTRIASIASDIPKPMIPIAGKPILEHQIKCLKENKLCDIIIIVGHLGEKITEYFGDGSAFGVHIKYYTETEPLGSAGALFELLNNHDTSENQLSSDLLSNENFLFINGDIIFDIDFARFINFHFEKNALATLAVHPNTHPFDSSLLVSNTEGVVTGWLNKEDTREENIFYKNQVNAGVHILSKTLLKNAKQIAHNTGNAQQKKKYDLDRDILKPLVSGGAIYAYSTPEYIKDMGTPERYRQVEADITSGIVKKRNLRNRQHAIFLDRDGTINVEKGIISDPKDLELLPNAARAIRMWNDAGFLVIVITNQPVIARGDATLGDLEQIHNKLETLLGNDGALLNDIFFCPHHPDKGFAGERIEYKINCDCRKPKPGMILQAAKKYNIDLSHSVMLGDKSWDVEAGLAAGCKAFQVAEKGDYKDIYEFACHYSDNF
ncbi:MAG: HAD-IIIA family hydrolase [Treponemataceae bacterium]|nr:MAG: HAD-IIIA family hydrolase [Treponemataceae bacterium]